MPIFKYTVQSQVALVYFVRMLVGLNPLPLCSVYTYMYTYLSTCILYVVSIKSLAFLVEKKLSFFPLFEIKKVYFDNQHTLHCTYFFNVIPLFLFSWSSPCLSLHASLLCLLLEKKPLLLRNA